MIKRQKTITKHSTECFCSKLIQQVAPNGDHRPYCSIDGQERYTLQVFVWSKRTHEPVRGTPLLVLPWLFQLDVSESMRKPLTCRVELDLANNIVGTKMRRLGISCWLEPHLLFVRDLTVSLSVRSFVATSLQLFL